MRFLIYPLHLPLEMFACKELSKHAFSVLIVIGIFTIIPVMMIVYGVQNPTVACVSPCIQCKTFTNHTYIILSTPPIGVNVSQALIIGGVINIVLEIAFAMFAMFNKQKNFLTPIILLPTIPFLCAVGWMIVSFVVYTQTIELCTAYTNWWTVDMTALKWLLGANIGGIILLFGPYIFICVVPREDDNDISTLDCWCPLHNCCCSQSKNNSAETSI